MRNSGGALRSYGIKRFVKDSARKAFCVLLKTPGKYILCGILLLGISGCAGTQYTDKVQALDITQTDRKEVTTRVSASADEWRNSGVVLNKGMKYKISASGSWSIGPICGVTGPDGVGNSSICGGVHIPGSGSLLVGRVGEQGEPFAVGNGLELTAGEDGVLFFHINGGMRIFSSGYVNVTTAVLSPRVEQTMVSSLKSDVDELRAVKARPNKNAYAIVIGIEQYRQKLPKADFAVHDAQTVTEYLTKVMGYPEENVVTLTNEHATNVDFAKYFERWLPNNVEKNGSVFIYYSGHGAPNPKTGDAYLVPYDGDPTFIDQTGYSLKRLYESLGKLQAKEIIVALDSCFSGAGGRSVITKGARPLVISMESSVISQKIAVLSAASGDQISSTYDEKGHGLFTYFLLKGLQGEADTRKDGTIELGDLFNYIKPQVERIARKAYNNEQSPQLIAPNVMLKQKLMER